MANLVFSSLAWRRLNVRVGRFEPASLAFSDKRRLSVAPYEIYDYAFPGGPAFSDTQTGIEATGYRWSGFSYAAGWVNGTDNGFLDDSPSDFYMRAQQVLGAGEGMTAGQRVGLVGYWGKARPEGLASSAPREGFQRWGVDASLNLRQTNLALQYLRGKDAAELWPSAPGSVSFRGGFAELTHMPATNLVGFLRYDAVNTATWLNADVRRWTAGVRYYPVDQVALHVEYSRRTQDPGMEVTAQQKETMLTARADLAF